MGRGLCEKKGEMLATGIFSFSNNVFNRLLSQLYKNWDCVAKYEGLIDMEQTSDQ